MLVDGAHAPGMLAVDLDRLGADFFVGNLHKWCCAAARHRASCTPPERWRPALRPLVASWGEDEGFPLAFDDTGTEDPSAWLSAPRALRVLERLGLDRLRRHNVELAVAGQLRGRRGAALVPAPTCPRDPAVSMQLVPLPDGLAGTPEAAGRCRTGSASSRRSRSRSRSFGGRGFVRLSAHAYNAPADYAPPRRGPSRPALTRPAAPGR